jgi:hypothetical protein
MEKVIQEKKIVEDLRYCETYYNPNSLQYETEERSLKYWQDYKNHFAIFFNHFHITSKPH